MPNPTDHLYECFACWLDALGIDKTLAARLLLAGYATGVGAGAGRLAFVAGIPQEYALRVAGTVVEPDADYRQVLEQNARTMLTDPAPMSPDVAAHAKGHDHG